MTTSIRNLIGSVGTDGVGAVIDPNYKYDKTKYAERIVDNSSIEVYSQKTSGATIRQDHSAIYYNNGTNNLMVIYGGLGDSSSNKLNDVWEYNLDTDTWTQKTACNDGKRRPSAIYYNNGTNNFMVIFGGQGGGSNASGDVWEYNLDTDTWTQKTACEAGRSFHSAIYYNNGTNNLMVIYGGLDNDFKPLNDVWEYNLDTDTWTQKTSPGTTSRSQHSAIYYNNGINNLMIMTGGGSISTGGKNDVWEYNLDTDTWTEKIQDDIKPKYIDSAIYYNNGINNLIIVFGKYDSNSNCRNVWEYNLDTNMWLQKSSLPVNRGYSVIYYNNGTNNLMVIFGGYNGNTFVNDVWEYNLDITLILKILYPIIG